MLFGDVGAHLCAVALPNWGAEHRQGLGGCARLQVRLKWAGFCPVTRSGDSVPWVSLVKKSGLP